MITFKNEFCEVNYEFKSLQEHLITFTRIGVDGAHFITLDANLVQKANETLAAGETRKEVNINTFSGRVQDQIQIIFGSAPDCLLSDSPEELIAYNADKEDVLICRFRDGWNFLIVPKEAILHYDKGIDVAICRDRLERRQQMLARLETRARIKEGELERQIKELEGQLERERASTALLKKNYALDIEAARKALSRAEQESK